MSAADHRPPLPEHDFYVTGGTLEQSAPSYVERRADADLYGALMRGEFCYVLTSRQMEKASLMIRTAARLREAGAAVVVLDLTAIGQNLTAEQWYDGLLGRLGRQLDLEEELEEFWIEHERLGPLQRWMAALEQVVLPRVTRETSSVIRHPSSDRSDRSDTSDASRATNDAGRLVIFVDEIDAVRSLSFSADEFFSGVRECYNRRTQDPRFAQVAFCLLGVATPADLITDTRTSPFNIGRRIELTDFSREEAAPLALGLAHHGGTEARRKAEGDEGDVQSGRRIRDDETNPLVSVLKLSGVVKIVDGRLRVRNRIYDRVFDPEWVVQHMPDAELRRQRAAYRRGLVRAASVAGAVAVVMAGLSVAAMTNAARAQDQSEEAARNQRIADLRSVRAERLAASLRLSLEKESQARRALEAALGEARNQRNRANEQTERALAAKQSEERQRLRAEGARHEAVARREEAEQQRQIAVAKRAEAEEQREESRRRLVRLDVANGMRLVEEGDLFGSLIWFADAQRLDEKTPSRAAMHRMRFAAALRQCPKLTQTWYHEALVTDAAFRPDGARVWDATTGQPVTPPLKHRGEVKEALFSPDGRRVVTASDDGTARLWDAATGDPVAPPLEHRAFVRHAVFSPDGRRLLTAQADEAARLWDLAVSAAPTPPLEHSASVWQATFSPDGRRILTAAGFARQNAGEARVWDAATGKPLTPPLKHDHAVKYAAFSADGRFIVTASWDYTARVWDAATGDPLTPPLKHRSRLVYAAFSPDGRRVVTVEQNPWVAHIWDVPHEDRSLPDLRLLSQLLTGHDMDSTGGIVPVEGRSLRTAWQQLRPATRTPSWRHPSRCRRGTGARRRPAREPGNGLSPCSTSTA